MSSQVLKCLSAARSEALRDAFEHFTHTANESLRIVYSTQPNWPLRCHASKLSSLANTTTTASRLLRIAVLDSSFNPPTRAHAALASLPREQDIPFDAHLLIFSVRNADKGRGRAGDASPLERLEMMELLAYELETHMFNVAVALADEPLVFSKSSLVHANIKIDVPYQLCWLVGSDTITRVFHPRYYESEMHFAACCRRFFGDEHSAMLCAERSSASVQGKAGLPNAPLSSSAPASSKEAQSLLECPGPARDWYERGAISLRSLNPEDARHSSTAVRQFLRSAHESHMPRDQLAAQLGTMVPVALAKYLLSRRLYI